MWNLKCPYCGERAFKWTIKVMLGPARTCACRSCRKEVGTWWVPAMAGVFLFIGFVLIEALPKSPFRETEWAVALFAAIVIGWCAWFIRSPLVREDEKISSEP
jgi:hypothetical protein